LTAELGIERILTKPVKQSDLLDSITRAFGAATRDDGIPGEGAVPRPDHLIPLKLLLAEDGRVNQMVAIKLLEDRGHSVTVANDGREALEMFENETFDAILMDVQMPEMDGYQATEEIRKREEDSGSHIPIIAMTANAMKGDRERCLEAGMDDYVAKPVRSRELFSVLEKFGPAKVANQPAETEIAKKSTFDPEVFRRNYADNHLMREMIELFAEDSADLLIAARAAIADADKVSLQSAAHSLRGLVGNFVAGRALKLTEKLDTLSRKGDLPKAGRALDECEREFARLQEALATFVKTLDE
jgi:CheY-like chemotaxis protein